MVDSATVAKSKQYNAIYMALDWKAEQDKKKAKESKNVK